MPVLTSRRISLSLSLSFAAMIALIPAALRAEDKKGDDGKYMTSDGSPTYKVGPDGTVDWFTFSGFRRYHSSCHVCHGPDGLGGSYAPNLIESLKHMTYDQYAQIVINGKKEVNSSQNLVMPQFGTDKNVVCYLDDIYVYLKARSDDKAPRGRPEKHEPVTEAAKQNENQCMGG